MEWMELLIRSTCVYISLPSAINIGIYICKKDAVHYLITNS